MTVTLSLASMILTLGAIVMAAGLGQLRPGRCAETPAMRRIRRAAGPAIRPCWR
jgi:hypothetical protein